MSNGTQTELNVLTLNCWGLKFVAKERQDRLTAIGRYLADASRGYDIVGLQEVWVYDDYLRIGIWSRRHFHTRSIGTRGYLGLDW
ncbi:unnamed protein product [Mortierella alpina]